MEWLRTLVRVAVFLVVFALGTNVRRGDLRYLFQRPRQLLLCALAIYVITPAFAVLLVRAIAMPKSLAVGLLLLSIAPGAPLTPRPVGKAGGNRAYAYSLLVSVALLAIVAVPLALAGLSRLFPADARIAPREIARSVAWVHLIPLLGGLLLARASPHVAARVSRVVGPVALGVVVIVVALIFVRSLSVVAAFGATGWFAILLLAVVAVLVGHLLGGATPEDRAVLAINNALRFPGTAALIAAAAFPGLGLLPALVSYLLVAAVVSGIYGRLVRTEGVTAAPLRGPRRRPA